MTNIQEMKKEDYGYFTMLDRNLFVENVEGYENLDKVLLVYNYVVKNINRYGFYYITLEQMILDIGFKPNNNKGRINDKIRAIIIKLKEDGYIDYTVANDCIKPKDLLKFTMHEGEKGYSNGWVQLYDAEYDTIMNYDGVEDKNKLLLLYVHIKGRCWRREGDRDIMINGGRAEVCFPSIRRMSQDTKLNEKTISEGTKLLEITLGLITSRQSMAYSYIGDDNKEYTKNGVKGYMVNIYGFFNEERIQHELSEWESWYYEEYQKKDRKFIKGYMSSQDEKDNHRFNCTLGGLRSALKRGTITEDGKKELKRLETIKNGADETCHEELRDFRKDIEESKKHNEKVDIESIEKSSTLANEFMEDIKEMEQSEDESMDDETIDIDFNETDTEYKSNKERLERSRLNAEAKEKQRKINRAVAMYGVKDYQEMKNCKLSMDEDGNYIITENEKSNIQLANEIFG